MLSPMYPIIAGWSHQPCKSASCVCSLEEEERDEHSLLAGKRATGQAHTASNVEGFGFGVKLRVIFPRSLRVWRNNKRRVVELFSLVCTLYCTDIYVHDVAVIQSVQPFHS